MILESVKLEKDPLWFDSLLRLNLGTIEKCSECGGKKKKDKHMMFRLHEGKDISYLTDALEEVVAELKKLEAFEANGP